MKTNDYSPENAYAALKIDIMNLIDLLESEMRKHPKKIRWMHVGSLLCVRQNLSKILSLISSSSQNDIETALEEMRWAEND